MLTDWVRERVQPGRKVSDDWRALLSAEKQILFDSTVAELETSYAMLSVTLDEALAQQVRGRPLQSPYQAREEAAISADLVDRLAVRLGCLLEALTQQGRHCPTLPPVFPLDPEFFRRAAAQRTAAWNFLLHHVLLGPRARFFHKLRALEDCLAHLVAEYRKTAGEITDAYYMQPGGYWQTLEALHDDLNTCLRETTVVLKSFLRALPPEWLPVFQHAVECTPGVERGQSGLPVARPSR